MKGQLLCQHRDQYSEYRCQHRALLPVTHRPRNSEMHDNDCCDLPPAPVLAAMKEEDPPESVKENQHHGHKSCREKKRCHQGIAHLTWLAGDESVKGGYRNSLAGLGGAGSNSECGRNGKKSRQGQKEQQEGFVKERCDRELYGAQVGEGAAWTRQSKRENSSASSAASVVGQRCEQRVPVTHLRSGNTAVNPHGCPQCQALMRLPGD